jgi:translation elongation factor EF-Ts
MQIAAARPLFLSRQDIPEDFRKKQQEFIEASLDESVKTKP